MNVLDIEGLSKAFGGLQVIRDFSLSVRPGSRHAIIGPNGAGKTTLFNMITGWIKPDTGKIIANNTNIAGMSPEKITRGGLSRSFQRNALLTTLTVEENLRIATQMRDRARLNPFAGSRPKKAIRERVERISGLLGLDGLLDRPVSDLSYGYKRQLEVALALCSEPTILLLDEPAAGTSPSERTRLIELIRQLPDTITVVIVEHDMDVVFDTCDTISVISYGETVATGTPTEIRENAAVRAAYLGQAYA